MIDRLFILLRREKGYNKKKSKKKQKKITEKKLEKKKGKRNVGKKKEFLVVSKKAFGSGCVYVVCVQSVVRIGKCGVHTHT